MMAKKADTDTFGSISILSKLRSPSLLTSTNTYTTTPQCMPVTNIPVPSSPSVTNTRLSILQGLAPYLSNGSTPSTFTPNISTVKHSRGSPTECTKGRDSPVTKTRAVSYSTQTSIYKKQEQEPSAGFIADQLSVKKDIQKDLSSIPDLTSLESKIMTSGSYENVTGMFSGNERCVDGETVRRPLFPHSSEPGLTATSTSHQCSTPLSKPRSHSHTSSFCSNISGDSGHVPSRHTSLDWCINEDHTYFSQQASSALREFDVTDSLNTRYGSLLGHSGYVEQDECEDECADLKWDNMTCDHIETERVSGAQHVRQEHCCRFEHQLDTKDSCYSPHTTHHHTLSNGQLIFLLLRTQISRYKSLMTHHHTLSNGQLIFLLLRTQISRYKSLMEEMSEQKRVSKSQQKSIASLIQALVIVLKKGNNSSIQIHKLCKDVAELQRERCGYMNHQKRMYICICVILCLYITDVSFIKRRIMSLVKLLGIVDSIKKINKTRKNFSDNWRQIPSVLTDILRIFIFRTTPASNCVK